MADGKITIETELDSSEAKKDLKDIENKAKKSFEDVGKSVDDDSNKLSKFGSVAKSAVHGATAVVKGVGVAVGLTSTAVAGLVKQSVDAYSSYEQLVGGVNTLFGAGDKSLEEYAQSVGKTVDEVEDKYNSLMNAQSTVMKNAAKAYTTAGLSANAYMEQITGFSASLVQSLGGDTEKAAEVGNRAIVDMSDNANKMGTSMEMIQNAYQGFAKQNYTMLDNLKLGYGGTKEEMQRLISDAAKMTDIQSDLNLTVEDGSLDFGNIINAISVMQTSLGIAGTTSKEAASTIEGSTNTMKAAWENLLVGVADDQADFDTLVNQFVDSVSTWSKNIMPRIEIALKGATQLIAKLLPTILEKIPELLTELAPQLIQAGADIITELLLGIANGLPNLLNTIQEIIPSILDSFSEIGPQLGQAFENILPQVLDLAVSLLPQFIDFGLQLVMALAQGIADNVDIIVQAFVTLIQGLVPLLSGDNLTQIVQIALQLIQALANSLVENLPVLLSAIMQIVTSIIGALPDIIVMIVEALPQIITAIIDALISSLPQILEAAVTLFMQLVKAIPKIIVALVKAIPKIIVAIITGLLKLIPKLVEFGADILSRVGSWFVNIITTASEKANEFVSKIIDKIKELPGKLWEKFKDGLQKVVDFGVKLKEKAKEAGSKLVNGIKDKISKLPDDIKETGKNLISGLWNGITDKFDWLIEKIKGFASNVTDKIKDFFGIHSPSRVMRDEVGKFLALGIAEGITQNEDTVVKAAEHLGDKTTAAFKRIRASQVVQFRVSDEITTSVRNSDAALARSLAISQTAANKQTQAGIDYKQMGKATAQGIKSAGIAVNIDGRKAGRVLDTTPKPSIVGGFA